uniref:SCP domain-containing protein n=1 Tax=Strongyloides papillosus TaxID=174720 RepID=A0A0N5BHQ6_STREA
MYNFYINYYITIITLSILFFQYHALENNVENDDNALLNFIQNDLSSKNSINQDSLINSISENKNLRKRQASVKQESRKSVPKKTGKPIVTPKKPSIPIRKPSKPTAPKPSTGKPGVKRPPPKTTTRGPTTRRRSPTSTPKRPTGQLSRGTTRPTSKTTTQRPVAPPKKPAPIPIKSKKTSRPAATTRPSTTTRSPTTTKSPTTAITTTTSASTSTFKTTPKINLQPNANKKLEIIKEINDLREVHKAPKLKVDQELSDEAQRLTTDAILHSRNVRYDGDDGLLVYYYSQGQHDNPVDVWLAGYNVFKFENPEKDSKNYSDLTQILWADSKKIGCGIDKNREDNRYAIACLISPKGNKEGDWCETRAKKSVPKKISKPNVSPKKPPVQIRKPSKPTPPRPSTGKPGAKPLATRSTTRRPTTKGRLRTSSPKRSNGKPSISTTRPASKTTTKGPVKPTKKPASVTITSKITSRPPKTTATTRRSTTTITTKGSTTTKPLTTSASTSTSKTVPKKDLEPFADEKIDLIKQINDGREYFHAKKLEIDIGLSNEAQVLATSATDLEEEVKYKNNDGLLYYYSAQGKPTDAFDRWFAGIYDFKFEDPENNSDFYSNFTQIIWAGSKKIGCGISEYKNPKAILVVCLVSPKGNIPDHYKENIHRH